MMAKIPFLSQSEPPELKPADPFSSVDFVPELKRFPSLAALPYHIFQPRQPAQKFIHDL